MIDQSAAKEELRKFIDKNHAGFVAPTTNQESIEATKSGWANVLYLCAQGISPVSTTATNAKDAFLAAAEGMHSDPSNKGQVFKSAVAQFASVLGSGMAGYTAVPPPSDFEPSLPPDDPGETDGGVACETISSKLAVWFGTGTAINNVSGATVPWS